MCCGPACAHSQSLLTCSHVQTINTFLITARTCTRALVAHDRRQHPGWWHWLKGSATIVGVECRILLLQLLTAWQSLTAKI